MLLGLIACILSAAAAAATPLQPTFSACEQFYNPAAGARRLNVTGVYANLVPGYRAAQLGLSGGGSDVLRVDLVGVVGSQVVGFDEGTNKLATLFTDTNVGGISVYKSTSWVCNSLFPATLPTPYTPFNTTYCPLPAGPFAMNLSIPLGRSYALTTLSTQVRIVDTSFAANTLSCVNISFTPYDHNGWYYDLFLWLPVALLVGFWVTSWGARFAAGWVVGSGVAEYGVKDQYGVTRRRELDKAGRRDARMRKWGTMLVSGLSGERLSVSSALLRFVTPGLRDIMFHIQFCTILVMIAVTWPGFAYSTITAGPSVPRVNPYPSNSTIPSAFSTQISDSRYPLYLDTSSFNPLLNLVSSAPGMESFATAVGLRAQDLFGTCLAIFFIIAAAVIIVSILIWLIHAVAETLTSDRQRGMAPANVKRQSYGTTSHSPSASVTGEKLYDPSKSAPVSPGWRSQDQLPYSASQEALGRPSRGPTKFRRALWRFRPKGEAGAFHAAALYGNLLRLILIFHLPITTFSAYQLSLGARASVVSKVFAALVLIVISILIPAGVMWKVYKTPSGKLYDATRTLLAMGTMYNHYVMDKQLFRICPLLASLVTGIVVGAGQGSGIAQAIIMVLVELVMLIAPALWYPWGEGASMGAPSVFKGVIRVMSALLVMLLSPVFSMTEAAHTWIAYTILMLNAIVFLFFLFMLLTKIVEGLIRLSGGVHFDESTHPLDGGIFAAIADLDCLNGVTGGKAAARKRRKHGARQLQRNVSAQGSLTTQRMLDKNSLGVQREPQSPEFESMSANFPTAYPRMSDGYFPTIPVGVQPPLGPPPQMERHSSESREEAVGGNIMDAWRTKSNDRSITPGTAYAPSVASGSHIYGAPQVSPPAADGLRRSFSVVRGGRADADNPYAVQASGGVNEFGRSLSPPVVRISHATPTRPTHQRGYSNPVIIETLSTSGGPTSPTGSSGRSRPTSGVYSTFPANKRNSAGLEPVELVPLRPPEMTIPKRRSLNDLKNEAEAEAASEDESDSAPGRDGRGKAKAKGKRSSKMWFSRIRGDDDETEESDDEPGPSRSRRRSRGMSVGSRARGVEEEEEQPKKKGWKARLGIGRKVVDEDEDVNERARDENKARKDALANESGALFAGVESPMKKRQRDRATARFSRPVSGTPLGPIGEGSEGKKGFVVNRKGPTPQAGPSRPLSPPQRAPLIPLGPISTPLRADSDDEPRSFRVKRIARPTPTAGNMHHPGILPGSKTASPQGVPAGTMDKVSYPPSPAAGGRRKVFGGKVGDGGDSDGSDGGTRSFRVIRKGANGSAPASETASGASSIKQAPAGEGDGAKRSFVVNRSVKNPAPPVETRGGGDSGGYSSDAFVPIGPRR